MSFSNDEQILVEGKSTLKSLVLILGIGLLILSLFKISFCTINGCRSSIETFLIGGLAMFGGGASITWLANPFLIVAWVLLLKNKKSAWLVSLIALGLSITFLCFNEVIENEAGQYNPILKVRLGYWLWVASCAVTFIGSLLIRIIKPKAI